jgi:hypothetical protein
MYEPRHACWRGQALRTGAGHRQYGGPPLQALRGWPRARIPHPATQPASQPVCSPGKGCHVLVGGGCRRNALRSCHRTGLLPAACLRRWPRRNCAALALLHIDMVVLLPVSTPLRTPPFSRRGSSIPLSPLARASPPTRCSSCNQKRVRSRVRPREGPKQYIHESNRRHPRRAGVDRIQRIYW